jgi:hypothetical protein
MIASILGVWRFFFMMNYSYYNPMLSPQQRLAQMEAQYPQFSQQIGFKVIPVANIEEANASQVDLNGNPVFFYNKGKNEIYLKQFNIQTGLADFYTFSKMEMVNGNMEAPTPITKEDFKQINEKLDGLYSILKPEEKPRKAVKNDE